jgi:hypothetical protein
MDTDLGLTFPPGDPADPTLDVDDLSEFWPTFGDGEDQTLAVGAGHEWFGERTPSTSPQPKVEAAVSPEQMLEAGSVDDYFRTASAPPDADEEWPAPAETQKSDGGMSESQRAALEFERFAEEFHAFARAASGRDCTCRSRFLVDSHLRK